MAGRGPAPDPGARRRVTGKAKDRIPSKVIDPVPLPEALGPPLPEEYEWPERTRQWWQAWRRCQMARTFTEVDWEFLLDTAPRGLPRSVTVPVFPKPPPTGRGLIVMQSLSRTGQVSVRSLDTSSRS